MLYPLMNHISMKTFKSEITCQLLSLCQPFDYLLQVRASGLVAVNIGNPDDKFFFAEKGSHSTQPDA